MICLGISKYTSQSFQKIMVITCICFGKHVAQIKWFFKGKKACKRFFFFEAVSFFVFFSQSTSTWELLGRIAPLEAFLIKKFLEPSNNINKYKPSTNTNKMSTTNTVSKVVHDASCIFCKIIKGEIPSFKMVETKYSFAFLDIEPISAGHTLIIPKYHGAKLHNLPDEYLADILPVCKKVTKILGCDVDGPESVEGSYNVLQNNGRLAHQVVDHVHFHVIPKPNKERGLIVGWPSEGTDFEKLGALHKKLTSKIEEANK